MFNSDYKLGCDAHKHFSLFSVRGPHGQIVDRVRIDHYAGAIQSFLSQFPEDTPVALETVGNWYCLHWAAGTRGSSTRSKLPAASRCSHTPTSPRK